MIPYAALIVLFPLVGFLINGLFGRLLRSEKLVGIIGSGAVGLSFALAAAIFIELLGLPDHARMQRLTLFTWIAAGEFSVSVSYQVDQLSILMTLVVTGVGLLIHVYSIGYMHGDRGYWRFFAYMNLFIFAMLNLVLADNYLLLFLGWEGVGLCSYLLIGFWYDRKFSGTRISWTGDAANKAFWVNRIGDLAFMLGMFLIFREFGSLTFTTVLGNAAATSAFGPPHPVSTLTLITLLLFIGATGKSAQIPLFIWLPDAMAGPTPVSALIHAATMVTAGVYMVARNALLFSLAPATMAVIAVVGATTALVAASIGIAQNDIKKVLAYSTVSQLGYMFLALGVGAFSAAIFHLVTHAFFKACLFLGSGSVIHAMHGEQDIRAMGGLKKIMPVTAATFAVSTFAIAGFPPFAGFFSKDEILWKAFSQGSPLLWALGAAAALMTAFYMFRLVVLTFRGEPRWSEGAHPHESPATMTVPLIILAGLAVAGGAAGIPAALGGGNAIEQWLLPVVGAASPQFGPGHFAASHGSDISSYTASHGAGVAGHGAALEYLLMGLSVAIALAGMLAAWRIYRNPRADEAFARRAPALHGLLARKYYIDEAYDGAIVRPLLSTSTTFLANIVDSRIIDGCVDGLASVTSIAAGLLRRVQTGVVQNYATVFVLGILIVLGVILIG